GRVRGRQRGVQGVGGLRLRPRGVPAVAARDGGGSVMTGTAEPVAGTQEAQDWSPDEMMTIAAARDLRDGQVCFVGIGLPSRAARSEEHTSELQSRENLVCRLLLEKKKIIG